MSDDTSPPDESLTGVAKRQAIHSIEGYDYQIWRTVEAWLGLRPEEALFIECAEDFDKLSAVGSVANQVKNSAEDISLGSSDVRSAISNYWRLRQDNPGAPRPTLRFLTRGGIRFEKSSLFGNRKGLDVWRTAAEGNDDDALLLARDLHTHRRIEDPSLLAFLARSNADVLRAELLSRIEWVVEQPGLEQVRLVVKHLVRRLGQSQDVSINRSKAAIPALLEHCREVAIMVRPDLRRLTLSDLHDEFMAAISISLPMTGRAELAIAKRLFYPADMEASALQFSSAAAFDRPPPIPVDPIIRKALSASISAALSANGAVLISGSVGRGKSAAAALAAAGGGGKPLWIELEGLDSASVALALEKGLMALRTDRSSGVVAIDGLPYVAALPRMVWLRFRDLLCECRQQGRPLLASAQGVNSTQIDSKFAEEEVAILDIPDIDAEEIETYFRSLGCPHALAMPLALLCEEESGGHPKLIHVRGRELKALGWPAPVDDILSEPGKSIDAARASARASVARNFSDDDKVLLYALSVSLLDFDRAVAMKVAASLVESGWPAESFDRLVGNWVEERGSGKYRVSALLTGQAEVAWTPDKVELAHGLLCDAFMREKSLRVDQAMPILLHALGSKQPKIVSGFIGGIVGGDAMQVPGLAEHLAPFALMSTKPGQVVFPPCLATSLAARMLQFRIAAANDDPIAVSIADAWRWEIDNFESNELRANSATMWGICVADIGSDADFSPETLVLAIAEVVRGAPALEVLAEKHGKAPGTIKLAGKDHIGAAMFSYSVRKVRSTEALRRVLDALVALEPDTRSTILGAFDIDYARDSNQFFGSVFLGLCNAERPNWPAFVTECERADELARQWGCARMSIASLKVQAMVVSEKLADPDKAIALLEAGLALHPGSSDLLAQIGTSHFNAKRYKEALAVFELALDKNLDCPEANAHPYTMRLAALACHALGDLVGAAQWFEAGAGSVRRLGDIDVIEISVGLDLDAAHCWIVADQWSRAVKALLRAHEVLAPPVDRVLRPGLFAMKEMSRTIFAWAKARAQERPTGVGEPHVGMCSSKAIPWERLPDNHKPFDPSTAALVFVARAKRISLPGVDALRVEMEQSNFPHFSSAMWIFRAEDQFASGDFEPIAVSLSRVAGNFWRMRTLERLGSGNDMFDPKSMWLTAADCEQVFDMRATMMAACMLRAVQGKEVASLIEHWLLFTDSAHAGWVLPQALEVKDAASVDFVSAKAITRDATSQLLVKMGAALAVLSDPRRSPFDTAWSQAGFLYWLIKSDTAAKGFLVASLEQFADGFCGLWRVHVAHHSLLDEPVAGPALLEDAIRSSGSGAARLIRLFKAVNVATGVELPSDVREMLEISMRGK